MNTVCHVSWNICSEGAHMGGLSELVSFITFLSLEFPLQSSHFSEQEETISELRDSI